MSLLYNYESLGENNIKENLGTSNVYSDVDLSVAPNIDYDSLNALWYNPKIEMLIITPDNQNFIDAVKPLMEWKNEKGVKTVILSNFSLYGGFDNAEKIRNMIKEYYQKHNIRWVLLAGDTENSLIPIRKVYNPDVYRVYNGLKTETIGGEYEKPTDYYYADLTGSWDSDGDGEWGEAPQDNSYGLDEISWDPEVYVGRLPADNAYELEIMINKTLKYETNPEVGDWMNKMLLAGGESNTVFEAPPDGEYESDLTSYIIDNYAKNEVNYTHLVEEAGNFTQSNLRNQFNSNYSTVMMAGHGKPTALYRNPLTVGYASSDANSSSNINKPSLVYLDSCSTSSYDYDVIPTYQYYSIGETLIKRPNAGAIGCIGGLRVTYYRWDDTNLEMLNRGNAKLFWKEFFEEKKFQQGRALYDSKVSYINSDYYTIGNQMYQGSTDYDFERKNLLTYCLLGDPELDIYTNIPISAQDPFTENIFEGQLVSVTIKDIKNKIVPYARVHLTTLDGKYYTAYADKNGLVSFRVPAQENEFYNVTITGHNLIPSYFNFTTLPDLNDPEITKVELIPQNPSTSNNIVFNIDAYDNQSGIECVYVFLSKDNFSTYLYYGTSNNFDENDETFSIEIGRLGAGIYSYFIFTRDYANNTRIFYNTIFNFSIPTPFIDYILIIAIIMIAAVAGVSIFLLYRSLKRHSRMVQEI
ncbi:MAG: C25 family cysteine peptidase [Promethearchaeota archaeon]